MQFDTSVKINKQNKTKNPVLKAASNSVVRADPNRLGHMKNLLLQGYFRYHCLKSLRTGNHLNILPRGTVSIEPISPIQWSTMQLYKGMRKPYGDRRFLKEALSLAGKPRCGMACFHFCFIFKKDKDS